MLLLLASIDQLEPIEPDPVAPAPVDPAPIALQSNDAWTRASNRRHCGLSILQSTNDLHLDADGNLAIARGPKAVAQHVRQRLMTHEREWFLDTTAGVPWIYDILGSKYNPALSEAIVKAEILDTAGVTEITSFSVSFNREVRRLNIKDVEAGTIYDEEVRI